MLDRVARVWIAVSAAEVEEVGVNQGDDILGEIGRLERDRGKVCRFWKARHEPAPVGHPLEPRHAQARTYATANAAQFAITRARLQEARSAAGRSQGVTRRRSVAPAGSGCERRAVSSGSVASTQRSP